MALIPFLKTTKIFPGSYYRARLLTQSFPMDMGARG